MIDALKFVQGAVAAKDFVPALQHFRIQHGFVRAFNGTLGLCSPIAVDLDVAPAGEKFVRAIEACGGTVALSLTATGRLLVKSGDFKTFVDTTDPTTFPPYDPQGTRVPVGGTLLPALRYLAPFIADDASKEWARGILFDGESAFATNNIVLQQYWLGYNFPCRVNIPKQAITELLRIDQDPIAIQMSDNRVTFHFEGNRWLTTNLYVATWPDVSPVLDRESNQVPVPKTFFEVIGRLLPFTDEMDRIFMHGDRISTSATPEESGTTIACAGVPTTGVFNGRQLALLEAVVETLDLAAYPNPALFYGGASRGCIVGIRG